MGNRQRILDAAVELMNRKGSLVGTTQLASHLAISPGNLYYHFRNREEILSEVLTSLQSDLDEVLDIAPGTSLDAERLARCFSRGAQVLWKYRFFFSSAMEMVMKNESLAKQYRTLCKRGTTQVQHILALAYAAEPGPQPLTRAACTTLAENMWVLWISWPRYTEITMAGDLPEDEIMRSHQHLTFLLQPYLSATFFNDVVNRTKALSQLTNKESGQV